MDRRKELKNLYKSRTIVGGVYRISCSGNGRIWIKSTKDLQEQQNRFRFFISGNYCPEPGMRAEWKQYGAESFSLTVLEELKKGETQTEAEFAKDIETLYEIWVQKQEEGSV